MELFASPTARYAATVNFCRIIHYTLLTLLKTATQFLAGRYITLILQQNIKRVSSVNKNSPTAQSTVNSDLAKL